MKFEVRLFNFFSYAILKCRRIFKLIVFMRFENEEDWNEDKNICIFRKVKLSFFLIKVRIKIRSKRLIDSLAVGYTGDFFFTETNPKWRFGELFFFNRKNTFICMYRRRSISFNGRMQRSNRRQQRSHHTQNVINLWNFYMSSPPS